MRHLVIPVEIRHLSKNQNQNPDLIVQKTILMQQSILVFDCSILGFDEFMELKEMQTVFDAGGLTSATIARAPMMNGYILIVKNKKGTDHVMTAQRDTRGVPRSFKTIDAAAANAKKIGFESVTVKLS